MFLKDFLYFLTDDAGRSYKVTNGVIEVSSTPSPLTVTPDGWQEKSVKWGRSLTYLGLLRSFTTPLKFVGDAAYIIRRKIAVEGPEAKIYLVITRMDKRYGGAWKHKLFFRGELDLTSVEGDEVLLSCNIMEGDLAKLFKANESTVYEIPIDVPEAVNVKMDGLAMRGVTTYTLLKSFAAQSMGRKQILPMTKTTLEGKVFNVAFVTDYGDLIDGAFNEITSADLTTSDKWLLKPSKAVTAKLRIKGSIAGSGPAGNTWKAETSQGRTFTLGTIEQIASSTPYAFDLSVTVTLNPDEAVFIYRTSTTFNTSGLWNYTQDTQILIETVDKAAPTFVKALRPAYLFQQLLDKVTGTTGVYSFSSSLLSGEWDNLLITGMDAVRKADSPKIKMSLAKLFKAYNVVTPLSLTISGASLIVENDAYAFDNSSTVLDVGEVREFKYSIATDFMYNTIRVGYPDVKTDDINGKDEFNTTTFYGSPITREVKELDLSTEVFASMYQIEAVRVDGVDADANTNRETDNDSAFLHIEKAAVAGSGTEPTEWYRLYRQTYDSITGVLDPVSAFNVELSPARCMRRHGSFLRSIFYWHDAKSLNRTSSLRSSALKTVKGLETIEEAADITLGSLSAPLFIPIRVKFNAAMPYETPEAMATNPRGVVQFDWLGDSFKGFIFELGIQPANNAEQETNLILTPDNDLNLL